MSVVPLISGSSDSPTASTRSRLIVAKPSMYPLCMNSHRLCRNGWQLVCWTGDPITARTCLKNSGELT